MPNASIHTFSFKAKNRYVIHGKVTCMAVSFTFFFFLPSMKSTYMEVREIKQFKKDNSTSNIIFATHDSHNRIRSHIP